MQTAIGPVLGQFPSDSKWEKEHNIEKKKKKGKTVAFGVQKTCHVTLSPLFNFSELHFPSSLKWDR